MNQLLEKLGIKNIKDLTDDELRSLVSQDRWNRQATRIAGRIKRQAKDDKAPKTKKIATLESIGLAPEFIVKLRASGKTDGEIITVLKAKGII